MADVLYIQLSPATDCGCFTAETTAVSAPAEEGAVPDAHARLCPCTFMSRDVINYPQGTYCIWPCRARELRPAAPGAGRGASYLMVPQTLGSPLRWWRWPGPQPVALRVVQLILHGVRAPHWLLSLVLTPGSETPRFYPFLLLSTD